MQHLSDAVQQLLQILLDNHIVAAIAGATALFLPLLKFVHAFRESGLKLADKKTAPLIKILKKKDASKIPPLQLEMAFRRAGYKLSTDEILFALSRKNTTRLLTDLKYTRFEMKFKADKTGWEQTKKHKRTLGQREKRLERITNYFLMPLLGVGLLNLFFLPAIGALFAAEIFVIMLMLAISSRSLLCAQRLEDMENYPSIEKRQRKSRSSTKAVQGGESMLPQEAGETAPQTPTIALHAQAG